MSDTKHLDQALFSGLAWTALLRWSSQIVSWTATFFAARLLMPADYGLVSMAMIPIGLVRMVEDFGLDAILIQDRTIVGERQAQLAGFILGIGVALTALSLLLAYPIGVFFNEPQVASLVSLLGALFIADAIQVVPRAILQRNLQYSRLAIAFFAQVFVTQTALVLAAAAGWGVWALVVDNVAGTAAITAMLLWWAPYQVRWPRDIRTLAQPLKQGWRMMASRFAYFAYTTADQTVIGRVLGKDALGGYSFTLTFANLPFQEAASIVTKVVPGVFSEVQHRREELRRYFLVLTECLAYFTLPASVGLALTADLAVRVLLGPNWDSVVLPLQVMCIYSVFQGSQILISPVMVWTGQFRATMWCSILAGVTMPISFLLAANFGLVAIAAVWAVVYPLVNLPPLRIGLRTIEVSALRWLDASAPAAYGSLVMVVAVIALRSATTEYAEAVRFAVAVGGGAVTYAATVLLFFRRRVQNLLKVIVQMRGPRRSRALKADTPPA